MTKHRPCSVQRWPCRESRSGRSSSPGCNSRTANALRRLRRTRDARSQLAAARDGFERLGARPWARRAATDLGATGATRQRVNGGGASLTLQEREVARLAATGMTNREIAARLYVAPRTVSAHLYRIFPKLGITSRAALRDALNAVPGDAAP
jgi:DNA-binding CsgD family transcriptional regulator